MKATALMLLVFAGLVTRTVSAQVPNPTRQPSAVSPGNPNGPMPIFRVTVVSRTTKAVNYNHRNGSTRIDFRGTELMPTAKGEAKVESQMGSTKIETYLDKMTPASQFGPEYMTYVLWGVTTEGRPENLGEVVLEGNHAKLLSTTSLQTFGLIVTAEPYFAVTQPSDVVVAENFIRNDTTGTIQEVDAKYELLQRGQYVLNRGQYRPVKVNPKGPLQLAQAENAVEIARLAGAERYAGDSYQKAVVSLKNAQDFLLRGKDRKRSETNAREAAQMAEDARIITYRKIREEELANERAAAAQREADAKANADRSAAQARIDNERRLAAENERRSAEQAKAQAEHATAQAEQATAQAEQERRRAEQAKLEAQNAAAVATRERSAAEAAREDALAQQAAAKADADRMRLAAQQAENEKTKLRDRLRQQLSLILETRESARGLIVNISDVLFDFNQYTLKTGAREKMAKVAGILLAYPGLKVQLEGHTDAVGSEDYNMKLSENRANSVREYLQSQGVPAANLSAVGYGKTRPVASNDSASGRQQNRRVEMVVSGEPIGIDTQQ
ncbi:MAG: OmpA family protein [Candidatus Solibacter sp.]